MKSSVFTNKRASVLLLLSTILTHVSAQQPSFESEINILNTSFVNVLEKYTNDGYLIFQNANLSGQNCIGCNPIHKVNINGEIVLTEKLATNTNFSFVKKVIKSLDGNFIATGNQTSHNAFLIKFDSSYNVLWSNWYQFNQEYIQSRNILKTADGGYVIAGTTNQNNSFLAKFDSLGVGVWAKTFNGLNPFNIIVKIIEDPFGNLYALQGISSGSKYLLKLDNMGDIIWSQKFQVPSTLLDQTLHDIIYDNLNQEIIISSYFGLIKVDSAGNKIWDKQYLSFNYGAIGYLFMENNGNFISICNSSYGMGIILSKFDSSGTPFYSIKYAWTDPYDGINTIEAEDIIRTSDSSFFIIGSHDIYYTNPPNIVSIPYFFKTTGTYQLACHSFPWSEQITSSNQYVVDTVAFVTQTKSIISSPLPTVTGTLSIPDTVICTTTSIPSYISKPNLLLYPNPNSGEFYITLPDHLLYSKSYKLEIYNNLGEEVYNKSVNSGQNENTIKISLNMTGLYLVKYSNSELSSTVKVLINH